MGGKSINTSDTKLEALSIQSSCYGAVIPWLRGMQRVAPNLIWYGDFKAVPHTQETGGKGGGGSSQTSFTYTASVAMGLCHGTITSVNTVWRGKGTSTAAALGFSTLTGAVGQAQWSVLNGRGLQTLNYSGLAFVGARNYELGDSASVENHTFEVQHSSAYSVVGTTPDVDPAAAVYDLLTHPTQGANFPTALVGDWTQWSNYCVANGLLVSPLLTTQVAASAALQTMADLTNAGIVWSGGKLQVKPYGDVAVTGNGRTFTPDITPVYELDDNCYIKPDNDVPLKRQLKTPADRFNIIKLKYLDRSNGYNPAIVQAQDLTDISANGPRPKDQIDADWICDGTVARLVAQLLLQRALHIQGEFTFRLSWHYALLEVMDLVTLTDTVLQLADVPARVIKISEEGDEELAITCEDFPSGVASAPLYPSQGMTGFALNANVSPGSALAPVIFELPGALTTTGLELGIASGSADPNWGGCQVWVSFDGTTYRQVAELQQSSRFGTLNSDSGSSLSVNINAGQQLLSGSATDAARLATLCYLAPAGAVAGEYIAHQGAALVSAGVYTLSDLVRAAYGTTQAAHATAAPFVRVDDAIARSGPLDPALIGKTVYVKLCSFNVFGAAVQSLADVSATTYTITGAHFVSPSATLGIKKNVADFAETLNYNECWIHGHDASGAAIDAPGKILVNGQTVNVPNGLLYGSQGPGAFHIVLDRSASTFTIAGGSVGYPYVAGRKYGGQWQYDNNSAWTAFTPTAAHVLIGTVETGAPDSGFPGAPPGVVAATMWAHAATLDAQVVNSTPPSIRVTGDNQNAVDNGFSGRGVEILSTGYLHNTGGRGHTLVLWSLATDTLAAAPATFDTYISTASLITALAGVGIGQLVALYTGDASSHDAALRTALEAFGGSATYPVWSVDRVSHVFIGQRGLLPGQAYAASSAASDASGVVSQQAYYTVASIVKNGAAGTDGTPGAAGADGQTSYLHIKYSNDGGSTFTASSGEAPGAYIGTYTDFTAADSTSVGAYTWALIKGADGTNGTPGAAGADGQTSYLHIKWSNDGGSTFTASSGETPGAYIGTYTDFTAADSTSVGAYTWALIKGADGTNGTPGAAGADGQTSYLHIKWSNDGGSTFTASSGETPGAYIGTYTDFTAADSGSVGSYTWALIKGADGTNGTPGTAGSDGTPSYLHIKWSDDGGSTFTASGGETPGRYIGTYTDSTLADSTSVSSYTWALVKGTDGLDAISMTLSSSSVTLQADSTGLVSDYSPATTAAKVMRGSSDDTSNWTLSRTNGSGVTSSLSGATLSVTAITGDTGYVDITATRSGFASQTARFTLAKAKGANPASGPVSTAGFYEGYHVTISPSDCSCYVEFRRDGSVYTGHNPSTNTHAGDWYLPNGSTVGDAYEIRFDQIASSGLSGGLSGGTVGAWQALTSAQGLTLASTENTNAVRIRKFTYVIRDASTKVTVCTGTFNLDAEVEV